MIVSPSDDDEPPPDEDEPPPELESPPLPQPAKTPASNDDATKSEPNFLSFLLSFIIKFPLKVFQILDISDNYKQ